MKVEDALARYVTQLEADGRSDHTVRQYRRHIALLAKWLYESGHCGVIEEIGHEDLAMFLVSPCARTRSDGRGKTATSTNALRSSLRTFFRFGYDAGYCTSNPARLIRRALCGVPPPKALSIEDQGRLLRTLAAGKGRAAERDAALFGLLLGSGVRIGSALALEVSDVDLDRGEIRLRKTKGDMPVVVPIGRSVCDHLRRFIGDRRDGPLFRGANGQAMSRRQAQRRLRRASALAGLPRAVSPHALRHTFAVQIYRRTHDLLLVQQALRHQSIASTTVYARCEEGRLRAVLSSSGRGGCRSGTWGSGASDISGNATGPRAALSCAIKAGRRSHFLESATSLMADQGPQIQPPPTWLARPSSLLVQCASAVLDL